MVERNTDPTPVPSLRNGTGRHPDGDTVPHHPRPAPTRRERRLFWAIMAVVALAIVIGALR